MKALFSLALLLMALPLLAEPAASSADRDQVMKVAREFWIDLNLGDLEKLPALTRTEDAALVPTPKSPAAAEMLKMKDLPEMAGIRKEIADAVTKLFLFSEPKIAPDGKTAEIALTKELTQAKAFFELKSVYNVYMHDAYLAQKSGGKIPSLDSIKSKVLAAGSPEEQRIDANVTGFQKAGVPPLQLDKTPQGWRMNIKEAFAKK